MDEWEQCDDMPITESVLPYLPPRPAQPVDVVVAEIPIHQHDWSWSHLRKWNARIAARSRLDAANDEYERRLRDMGMELA